MSGSPAFDVLYASDQDQFRTIQVAKPRDQKFYQVVESKPVFLMLVYPNTLDTSSVTKPVVRRPKGDPLPLSEGIIQGLVKVRGAASTRPAPVGPFGSTI